MAETSNRYRGKASAVDAAALAALSGRITKLEAQKRNEGRLSVYIDGEFALGVDQEVAVSLGLRTGLPVEGKHLLAALQEDERKRARDESLRFLATRPRSRTEVQRRLSRRYQADVVEATVALLTQNGWLDDAAFARAWIESRPGVGAHRLRADLLRRGVGRSVVDQVLSVSADRTGEAFKAAEARYRRMAGLDPQTARRRLYAFLIRRGFDYGIAEEAVRRAVSGNGEDGP